MSRSKESLSEAAFALIFTLLYAVLLLWGLSFHEMWFDETEPWLLALYSESYGDLLYNKRFEGHPNLWYSILFVVTKFTSNLKVLQITQATFSIGFVYLFLRYSPFPRLTRIMFCFGYYGLFEYGIISRLYAIELFTLFLICTFYPKRFSNWFLYIGLLSLNAQTNLFGFFVSGMLGLLLFSEAFKIWKESPQWVPVTLTQKAGGILFWGVACLFSFWSMLRPNENSENFISFFHSYYYFQSFARVWQAFAPVPEFIITFWNTSFLRTRTELLLSALLLVLTFWTFFNFKRLLIPLFVLFITLLLFFALKWEGSMRHHGHFFTYTLAFLWIKSYYTAFKPSSPFLQKATGWSSSAFSVLLSICLFLQVLAGIYVLYIDGRYPFYGGKKVAEYIKTLPPSTMVAAEGWITVSNVAAYLGRPIYHLPTGEFRSFYTLDPNEANDLGPYVLLDWAQAYAQQHKKPVVLISRRELPSMWHSSPVTFIAVYRGNYITQFAFYLYKIEPLPLPKKKMMADSPKKIIRP